MTLTPKAEPLAEKLRDIALYGRGIELRCIETRPVEGDIQRTLLAGAARPAHEINRVDGLVALCRGEQKPYRGAARWQADTRWGSGFRWSGNLGAHHTHQTP